MLISTKFKFQKITYKKTKYKNKTKIIYEKKYGKMK